MTQLLSIKIRELAGFVQSDLYLKLSTFPITKQRALSQAANPRAKPDDVALIIAYSDEFELLGYIGAFPDTLYIEGQPVRIAWNSCWWSNPQKGKPVVMKLFAEFIKAWGENICFCDLTDWGKNFIQLTARYKVFSYPGNRFFYRFYLARLIPVRIKLLNIAVARELLGFIDGCLNGIVSLFGNKNSALEIANFKITKATELSLDAVSFIRKFPEFNSTMRDKAEFDWIINHPWVLTDKATHKLYSGRYFFSYSAESFQTFFLEIRESSQLKCILLLQERDGHYRLPYAFFDPIDIRMIGECLFHQLQQSKALSFTTHHSLISDYLKDKKGYLKKSSVVRYAAFPNKFGAVSPSLFVQDGDGDAVFC